MIRWLLDSLRTKFITHYNVIFVPINLVTRKRLVVYVLRKLVLIKIQLVTRRHLFYIKGMISMSREWLILGINKLVHIVLSLMDASTHVVSCSRFRVRSVIFLGKSTQVLYLQIDPSWFLVSDLYLFNARKFI